MASLTFLARVAALGAGETDAADSSSVYIREYQVHGVHHLTPVEVGAAVYPFLGPGRTTEDVEQARQALEKVYRAKGYQTVSVQVPPQQVHGGIVEMQVTEAPVGRLRVQGSRYFSPEKIKAMAPSLAPGQVVNFKDVPADIVALNQLADRRVTPAMRAGEKPGTVDVDLNVKDTLPVHGGIELNNRSSADTSDLRLNVSLSATNLWQLGHTLGVSAQLSPQDTSEVQVYSAYYLARLPALPGATFLLQGTKQESNVSTLGDIAVAGRGTTVGTRLLLSLPSSERFYQSLSLGLDYKDFDQDIHLGATDTSPERTIVAPVTYFPVSGSYHATWVRPGSTTEFTAAATMQLRGLGSSAVDLGNSRYRANGGFITFRGEVAQTRTLPGGFEIYGRMGGQVANQPLLSAEQFSGGGLGTVRGYLESEAVGDNAWYGSLELRSPSLWRRDGDAGPDWRLYTFGEFARLTLNDPLPDQTAGFDLASVGLGTRFHAWDHLHGSLDAGLPLVHQAVTRTREWRLTFRAWADY